MSTIDTAFLFAGALTVATYFDRDTAEEAEVRRLANQLYERADWNWACNGEPTLTHGWTPENGFIPHRWRGYDEGLLLYFLGLGSPTHPLEPESYAAYTATYEWKSIYGRELLYSGPLFTHQLSHLWVDFRDIRDEFMRQRESDYFENSRRATFMQQEYAIRNPMNFVGYGQYCWGFTACDGPGWITRKVNGVERQFFDYNARGAPFGPDDGTIAPWVVIASLPFAPEIVIPTIHNFARMQAWNDAALRIQAVIQSVVCGGRQSHRMVDISVSLRHRPGADRASDRELPDGLALEHHPPLSADRGWPAPGRLLGRVAAAAI